MAKIVNFRLTTVLGMHHDHMPQLSPEVLDKEEMDVNNFIINYGHAMTSWLKPQIDHFSEFLEDQHGEPAYQILDRHPIAYISIADTDHGQRFFRMQANVFGDVRLIPARFGEIPDDQRREIASDVH